MSWLEREMWAAVEALSLEDECELIALGVEPWIFSRCRSTGRPILGLVGCGRISLEPRGHGFYLDPLGFPVFLTPIRRQRPETIAADAPYWIWAGELIDIIAWHPATPGKWAWRIGDADAAWLGLVPPRPPPLLPIHSSPLAWLRNGCRGICPLTSDCSLLRGLGSVLAESYAHREELGRKSGITLDDDRWHRETTGQPWICYPRVTHCNQWLAGELTLLRDAGDSSRPKSVKAPNRV